MPLAIFALGQTELALADLPGDVHNTLEHWKRMTVIAILMVVWGTLAYTELPGSRLAGWLVVGPMMVFALQSLLFPGQASAAQFPWAVAAAGWAVLYRLLSKRRFRTLGQSIDSPQQTKLNPTWRMPNISVARTPSTGA